MFVTQNQLSSALSTAPANIFLPTPTGPLTTLNLIQVLGLYVDIFDYPLNVPAGAIFKLVSEDTKIKTLSCGESFKTITEDSKIKLIS